MKMKKTPTNKRFHQQQDKTGHRLGEDICNVHNQKGLVPGIYRNSSDSNTKTTQQKNEQSYRKGSLMMNEHEEMFSIIYNEGNANHTITRYHSVHTSARNTIQPLKWVTWAVCIQMDEFKITVLSKKAQTENKSKPHDTMV